MPMSLPLSPILNVAVSVSPAAAPGPIFNRALIVGPSTVIPSSERVRQYTSLTQMATDGFATNSPEYLAAQLYFGQSPAPTYLSVGRQDLTAMKTIAIGAAAGTGYVVNDVVTVVQGGASGGQVQVTSIGVGGAVTGVALIVGSQGTGYATATNLATTGGSGTGLQINISAVGESAAQSVQACRLAAPAWYACMFVGTAVDADHIAIAGYIEGASPSSVYFPTSGSTGILNNTASNLFAQLQSAKYRRSLPMYSTTQGGAAPNNVYAAAAVMGYAMGANSGAAGSYFSLMFKAIAGVTAEPLTQSQAVAICGSDDRSNVGLNGNAFLPFANGTYSWVQQGVMASGVFFDEVLFLDMLAADIQVSGINLLTSVPALPITNNGVTQMRTVIAGACERSKALGFIAPSGTWQGVSVGSGNAGFAAGDPVPNGYFVYAPPVSSLSAGQRAARIMPPVTVGVIAAQSGHSLTVSIQVQR